MAVRTQKGIHRIGQAEVCHLWNLVAKDTREGTVYFRLLEKLKAEAEALGGKVYDGSLRTQLDQLAHRRGDLLLGQAGERRDVGYRRMPVDARQDEAGLEEKDINVLTLYRGATVIPNPRLKRTLDVDVRPRLQ